MKAVLNKAIHPLLFAAYPVIALIGVNIEEIKAETGLRALLLSVLSSIVIYLGLNWLLKNRYKAALITTLALVFFFSYGHIYNLLKTVDVFGLALGRHRLLITIWIVLFGLSVWWVSRRKGDLQGITQSLNIIGVVLLVVPLFQIGRFTLSTLQATSDNPAGGSSISGLKLPASGKAPDIYYIILDAYSRDDTLLQNYHLDNRDFLKQLEGLGFYVARCSQSNYAQTRLSLASSLNINYLQDLSTQYNSGNTSRVGLSEIIHHNAVRQALETLGYKSVAFETGFKGTQWEDADLYLSPRGNGLDRAQLLGGINPYEEMLLSTTAERVLLDGALILPKFIQPDFNNPLTIHRDLILYDFDQLKKMPNIPGPKLVFAHLVIPHPPYVFGPNGEIIDYDKPDDPGYQDQITYLDKVLIPLLQGMIQDSPTPLIIMIQGDHGAINAPPNKRLNILNAYYFPGEAASALYESISPVNTFRVLFNQYFGGQLKLLKDISYFSDYSQPYEYTVIPNQRQNCSSGGN